MDSNKSKRVVVYCRVATQAQLAYDHTLEAQSARLHEQAKRLGYEIVGKSASMKRNYA
ncbi:recombinase family protein [Flavonifractor plautii]|nr:recombinase family protein [Flavonifractor plautii]